MNFIMKGMIKGMEDLGAKFIGNDHHSIYFDINTGSEIDNEKRLHIASEAFYKALNLKLKIKRV